MRECVVELVSDATRHSGLTPAGREIGGSLAMMGGQTLTRRPEVRGATP